MCIRDSCGTACCPDGKYICNGLETGCIKEPKFYRLSELVPVYLVSYLVLFGLLIYLGHSCTVPAAPPSNSLIGLQQDPTTGLPVAKGGVYDPRELSRGRCPYCETDMAFYRKRRHKSSTRKRSAVKCPHCKRHAKVSGCTVLLGCIVFIYICGIGGIVASSAIMTHEYLIQGNTTASLIITITLGVGLLVGSFFFNTWSHCFDKSLRNVQRVRVPPQVEQRTYAYQAPPPQFYQPPMK